MVALLVEVRFYFSVDDLSDVDVQTHTAKELFLSTKCHLVYGLNLVAKCCVAPADSSLAVDIDGFFCRKSFDPSLNRLVPLL